jgi:LmbE family N-acetylglucosaminyl deacetylase
MAQKKQTKKTALKKTKVNYKKLLLKYRRLLKRQIKRSRRYIKKPAFAKKYVFFALMMLLATTVLWALLGASIASRNSDQLVDGYLFTHASTFHGAYLPGSHNFLIKWPLFALIGALGASSLTFTIFTVAVVLATVAILVLLIRSFEKRPLVFGTYCLALASVLLLVPAQPYPGGLLPVNMAMITTRNLEYVLYIASLIFFVRSPKIKSFGFWLAAGCLGLLIASDKLFLFLSVGGAILSLIVYICARQRQLVRSSARWLVLGAAAGAGAAIILWLINWSGLTHIANQVNSGPYKLSQGVHGLALGVVFSVLGILTNFGANPAFDTTILKKVPHQTLSRLAGPEGISFVINAVILVVGLYCVWQIIRMSTKKSQKRPAKYSNHFMISNLLIWSSAAAIFSYILTNHYYAADSRYLSISLFAVFIAAAMHFKKRRFKPEKLILAGLVISASILLGIPTAIHAYSADKAALGSIDERNLLVAQAMKGHPGSVLVGDYWRVMPTKLVSSKSLDVMSLASCTTPLTGPSSDTWQIDLSKHSFAYLLSLDHGLTTYPDCTLNQITNSYGRPNSSFLIAGSLTEPKEILLFYDHGTEKNRPQDRSALQETSSVLPIPLSQLPHTKCPSGHTVMNIVAHQDDDLLFLSPDLIHNIKAGYCVRTVYVTAGDAGHDSSYWLGREQGSQAAYSAMSGVTGPWIQRVVDLTDQEYIRVSNPQKDDYISLIFLRLPDGNLKGQGFSSSHYESLARLESGRISSIHSVTGQSVFTSSQLTDALALLIRTYGPSEIHTLSTSDSGSATSDHNDHMAVGRFTRKAYQKNTDQTPASIRFYLGYSDRQMPANITGADFQEKQSVFLTYAQFDGAVCHSPELCKGDLTYGSYLAREYSRTY